MRKISEKIALYIHIPFCKQKCLYCDFPSFSNMENLMLQYIEALNKEICSIKENNIGTIFIGGGTPTYLDKVCLNKLKQSIDKINNNKDIEFTIEANPGTINNEKLVILKDMGVNRLSIGLQAWQDKILQKIGRIHSIKDFLEGYNKAREVGFNNINIDVMFGLPGQTMEDWKETLKSIVDLKPEHISCYSLIIEEGTPFYNLYENDKLDLPGEELERNMYKFCVEFLDNNGYHQYEISNFALEGKECKHNLVYWNMEEYIGCGAAAHSYKDELRYRHTENIKEYIKDVNDNKDLKLDVHKNSVKDDMEEFMFMGLRKIKGISIEEFNYRFEKDIYEVYGEVINRYLTKGLLIKKSERLFLSKEGIQVSNGVMCDFLLD